MRSFAECLFADDTSRKHSSASQVSENIVSIEVLVEEYRVFIGSDAKKTKAFLGEFDLRLNFSLG